MDHTLSENPRVPIDVRLTTRDRLYAYKKNLRLAGERLTYDKVIARLLDIAQGGRE